MKYLSSIFCLCLILALSVQLQAQSHEHHQENKVTKSETQSMDSTSVTFTVYGNCGMCENRIEKSLSELEAVRNADWDVDSKVMTVSYDADQITLKDLHQKIADVGHDTDMARATQKVYDALPGCCQYDRKSD